ncbi:MAG: helix-turn-helix transcriptional regulator, partial [Bacteroidota bacterium]
MGIRFEFGAYLKSIRDQHLISQDTLAENSGLLRHQIIAIEKGKSNYTIDNLFKYLHGLNVSSINLEAFNEIFEFELTGSDMTLETIREKVTEKVIFNEAWVYKLDDSSPGHYGINDHEIELSSDDVFVNIPQRSFQFKNANFHFDLNLM